MIAKPKFGSLILIALLSACSSVISERTDEQAWKQFNIDSNLNRTPATSESGMPEIQALRAKLSEVPIRGILLECGFISGIERCYRDQLVRRFDLMFREHQAKDKKITDLDYRGEQARFLKENDYSKVYSEVERFHQNILSGMDHSSREHLRSLFKFCETEDLESTPISLESFALIPNVETEIPKGIYACLVSFWHQDMEKLLKETSERLGLKFTSKAALEWIRVKQVQPIYEAELSRELKARAAIEQTEFETRKDQLLQDLDPKEPLEKLLSAWTPVLRKIYPYSPVEQWIVAHHAMLTRASPH